MQLGHLGVINDIPEDLNQREAVVNRALDVRSAAMNYLAITIRHHATPLGTLGIFAHFVRLNIFRQGYEGFFRRRQRRRRVRRVINEGCGGIHESSWRCQGWNDC